MAPFQIRFGPRVSSSYSDGDEEEEEDGEDGELEDEEELESDAPVSSPLMVPSARGVVSVVEMVAAALRRSLVMCGSLGATEEEDDDEGGGGMLIGPPTDVRHVSHVTFDRFGGFLGLPSDLEPDVPRRTPSASASVFGVSPTSMQCSYDKRGNSVPTILLTMQKELYLRGGLQAEGIFRINAENSQEIYVREQLNSGVVPDGVDLHCLAGLVKAWFRELPTGVLDSLTPEQVMHSNTEEECALLVSTLPSMEAALLDWAINLMADVVEHEKYNKMNARNIAMVFAPNMTQMADPLTALIHAVQVMNFLKALILKTLKERKETAFTPRAFQPCSISPSDKDEPSMLELLDKPFTCSSQKIVDCPMIDRATFDCFLFGAEQELHHNAQCGFEGMEKPEVNKDDNKSHGEISPMGSNLSCQDNSSGKKFGNENVEGLFDRFCFRKGVGRLCRHPVFQLSRSMKKSGEVAVIDAPGKPRQAWV